MQIQSNAKKGNAKQSTSFSLLLLVVARLAQFERVAATLQRVPRLADLCAVPPPGVVLHNLMNNLMNCAWYNIGFHKNQLGDEQWHSTLEADLRTVITDFSAHVVMLCECGEVDVGLGKVWDRNLEVFCKSLMPEFKLRFWSIMRKEIIHQPIC